MSMRISFSSPFYSFFSPFSSPSLFLNGCFFPEPFTPSSSFLNHISLQEKQEIISALISQYDNDCPGWSDSEKQAGLTCLKILSRERQGIQELQSKKGLEVMMRVSELVDQKEEKGKGKAANENVLKEGLKVVINIIHGTPTCQNYFLDLNGLPNTLAAINSHYDDQFIFLYFRILFLMTASNDEVGRKLWKDLKALPIYLQVLHERCKQKLNNAEIHMGIGEVLKASYVLFNAEERIAKQKGEAWDPLLVELYQRFFPLSVSLINQGKAPAESPLFSTQLEALHILLLAPEGKFASFFESKDSGFLDGILHILSTQITSSDSDNLVENVFPPIVVLTKIATESKWARRYLKSQILPVNIDRSHRPEEGNSLKSRLVRLLTVSKLSLSAAVANFLFTLCKRNAKKFTRHVGMANAAGLLHQIALFNQEGEIIDTESETEQEDEDYNPVTGARENVPPWAAGSDMTEEEKEAEAERLVRLFERLNQTGVIQVMSQDAQGNTVPFNPLAKVTQQEDE